MTASPRSSRPKTTTTKKFKLPPLVPHEIERHLVLSTAHITQTDSEKLDHDTDRPNSSPMLVYKYPEGYFILAADADMIQAERKGYSEDLLALLRLAGAERCKFLHLDRDGPIRADLPRHSW